MTSALRLRRLLQLIRLIRRLRAARALSTGLLAFALAVLPHLLTNSPAPFHHELCTRLDQAMEPGHRLIGALPREHAKTTLGTVALVLREVCLGRKRNILLVAANRQEAQGKLRQIVGELEANPLLPAEWRQRLAPARDRKGHLVAYSDDEIVLTGGARITTIGFGGKVRGQLSAGRRLDLIVLDDPEDDATVSSPELRAKLSRWADHALLNALDVDSGSLVWLGTLLHHDSVLARWMERQSTQVESTAAAPWQVVRRAALDDQNTPLWPGRWSLARLEQRRREIGDTAFAQEYMNQPLSRAGQVFRLEDFGTYDPAGLAVVDGQWCLDGVPLAIAIGVDPAIGEGSRHDWFVACVVGLCAGRGGRPLIHVLDTVRARLRFAEQLAVLSQLSCRWRPRLIGIESVAYQAALSQAAWDRGLPVRALSENRPKAVRIETAAVHVAQGNVLLPVSGAWVADFRDEAADYPAGRHDDQLDAFARAVEAALGLTAGRQPGLVPLTAGRQPAQQSVRLDHHRLRAF